MSGTLEKIFKRVFKNIHFVLKNDQCAFCKCSTCIKQEPKENKKIGKEKWNEKRNEESKIKNKLNLKRNQTY